jgi:hypothetical protein
LKLRHVALALSILVGSGLVLAAYAQKSGERFEQSGKVKRKVDDAQLIRARANWFYRQRAYPLGHIPASARERAWNDFRQAQQAQRQSLIQKYGLNYRQQVAALAATTLAPITTNSWTAIGPQPTNAYFNQPDVSGRVTALVVDPCDTTGQTVFLGGALGGLWVTTNGGTNWTPLTDQAPSLAVGSIAVPPEPSSNACVANGSTQISKTVYVGTGEENFSFDSYYGAGVLVCANAGGATYSCARPPNQSFGPYVIGSAPLNSAFSGPFIGGLAVDPLDPSIMLAAVWGSGSTLPSGIWCSASSGVTWNHVLPSVTGEIGTAVAFDQAGFGYGAIGNLDGGASVNDSLNGIYKSGTAFNSTSNCGPGFSALSGLTNLAGGVSAMGRISFSVYSSSTTSSSSDEIFAAVANASDDSSSLNGIYKSTDGGNTWTNSTPSTYNGFCDYQCFYDIPIEIDPGNASVIYAGGSAPPFPQSGQTTNPGPEASIIASTDGGSTWTDVANNFLSLNGPHVDTHAFAFTPPGDTKDLLYAGTDGGVWSTASPDVSPSASQSWTDLNTTLGLTQIYAGMSNNPSGWQYRTFLGAQDNGTQVLAPDLANPSGAALAWNDTLSCGDGGITLVDPLIPSTMYGECAYIPGTSTTAAYFGIEKSLFNGNVNDSNSSPGNTFFEASAGINTTDDGNFIPAFAIDPEQTGSTGDAQTLYFGTYRVWQTTDGGNSWNAISPDVTGSSAASACSGANIANCVLTALAVAPTNSNEVVTGSSVGHIFVTTNAMQGVSSNCASSSSNCWTDVTTSALPSRGITQVAVDPANPNTLYATFSGFSSCSGCDNQGHVYVGTLATTGTPAVVWTDVSSGVSCTSPAGNLPDIPVNAIIVDPSQAGTLYVGTDVGVYMGTLQGTAPAFTGACWQPLGTGLPDSAVLSLTLNAASRTLIAGTHGRSAWSYSLGGLPTFGLTGLSPTSADAGGPAFTMALTGTGFTSSSTVNWTPQGGSATSLSQGSTTPPSGCATPTCIAVSVPTTLTAPGGIVQVGVSDPSDPSPTNSLTFTVTSLTPTVTSISPASGAPGNLSLSLTGSHYISSTTVGLSTEVSPLPCSPLTPNSGGTSTSISASISSACLQYGGVYFVSANNPPPGGGSSNPNNIAGPSTIGGGGCNNSTPVGCLLTVTAPSSDAPNDSFASAANITLSGNNTYSQTEDTSGAADGTGPAIPSSCSSVNSLNDNGDYRSVWFQYTPSGNATAEVDTFGSNYDTIISVWTGTSTNLSPVSGGCNDDVVFPNDLLSQITNLSLTGGTTYYFLVSDFGVPVYNSSDALSSVVPSGGKLVFNMSVATTPPPTFTASAGSVSPSSVTAGSSASFTLTVTGSSSSTNGTATLQPCTISPSTTTISCSYNPGSLSVAASSSSASTVTINTTARGAVPPATPFQSPPIGWMVVVLAAAASLAFLLMARRSAAGRTVSARARLAAALGFALLAGLLVFSVACGGGGGSSSSPPPPTGTQAGTYTITVPISPAPSNGNPSVQLTVQ